MWFSPLVMWCVGAEHTFVEACICVWGKTKAVPDAEFLLCTVSTSVLMVMKCETSNINPECQFPEGHRLRKTHPRTVKMQHASHLSVCSEPSGVTLIAEFFSPRSQVYHAAPVFGDQLHSSSSSGLHGSTHAFSDENVFNSLHILVVNITMETDEQGLQ